MTDSNELTHFDDQGRSRMVNVGEKQPTRRIATACGSVSVNLETYQAIDLGNIPKGNVFEVARIAGIMAAKQTDQLIPLCHSIPIESVEIEFNWNSPPNDNGALGNESTDSIKAMVLQVIATVQTHGKTGVEMEAMTAVSIAAMTVYDMVKSVQRDVVIGPIYLDSKSGGSKGDYKRPKIA